MSPILAPKVLISEYITKGGTVTGVKIKIFFTGTLDFEITADGDATTPTWDNVTLSTGGLVEHTFTVPGSLLIYRIVGSSGAVISSQRSITEIWTDPGISIEVIYEEE